jgi:hypothetical protein
MSNSLPTITLSIIHWQSKPPRPGPANQSYAPPQNSMPSWNMAKTMCQAGGAGLEQVIARLCPCCGSMMQLHPVLNDAKFF